MKGEAPQGGNLLYDCRLDSESTAAELRQLLRERRTPPSLEAWLCFCTLQTPAEWPTERGMLALSRMPEDPEAQDPDFTSFFVGQEELTDATSLTPV